MKILDFQGLTVGHPGFDIWTMVYSATDPEYRATHLETDLRAYYDIVSTYMEECPDFTQFMQELEEKRILGMVMFSKFLILLISKSSLYVSSIQAKCVLSPCAQLLYRVPLKRCQSFPRLVTRFCWPRIRWRIIQTSERSGGGCQPTSRRWWTSGIFDERCVISTSNINQNQ